MTKEQAITYLTIEGYTTESRPSLLAENTTSLYKRLDGSDCQCNGRPPAVHVSIYQHHKHLSMEIGIKGEAINEQWVDFKYYALPVDEVENIGTYEYLLSKIWEVVN